MRKMLVGLLLLVVLSNGVVAQDAAARKQFAETIRDTAVKGMGQKVAAKARYNVSAEGPEATLYVTHIRGITASECIDILKGDVAPALVKTGFKQIVCTDDGNARFAFDLIPYLEDAASAASDPQKFFMPDLGETVDAVKAAITVPDVSAECRQQQDQKLKQLENRGKAFAELLQEPSPRDTLCDKAWENAPHIYGTSELGYIEIGSLYHFNHQNFALTIYFKDGVVVRVKGLTKTLNLPQFMSSALDHYKVIPRMSSTTMQNGFGAKFEWPQADYDLPNGAHLMVIQTVSMDDAPSANPLLQFDMMTREGLADEAAKQATEQKKVDPFSK